jgi:hypothetical protein
LKELKPPYFAYTITLLPYILIGLGVLGVLIYFHGALVLLLAVLRFAGVTLIAFIFTMIVLLAFDFYNEQVDEVKAYHREKRRRLKK